MDLKEKLNSIRRILSFKSGLSLSDDCFPKRKNSLYQKLDLKEEKTANLLLSMEVIYYLTFFLKTCGEDKESFNANYSYLKVSSILSALLARFAGIDSGFWKEVSLDENVLKLRRYGDSLDEEVELIFFEAKYDMGSMIMIRHGEDVKTIMITVVQKELFCRASFERIAEDLDSTIVRK